MAQLPKPFKRPGIELGGPESKKREWADMFAGDIREGDTVVDFGLVTMVTRRENNKWVALTNVQGITSAFEAKKIVLAFVEAN